MLSLEKRPSASFTRNSAPDETPHHITVNTRIASTLARQHYRHQHDLCTSEHAAREQRQDQTARTMVGEVPVLVDKLDSFVRAHHIPQPARGPNSANTALWEDKKVNVAHGKKSTQHISGNACLPDQPPDQQIGTGQRSAKSTDGRTSLAMSVESGSGECLQADIKMHTRQWRARQSAALCSARPHASWLEQPPCQNRDYAAHVAQGNRERRSPGVCDHKLLQLCVAERPANVAARRQCHNRVLISEFTAVATDDVASWQDSDLGAWV